MRTPNGNAPTARDLHAAMVALRRGQVAPDEFRMLMRRSREQHGPEAHERIKAEAAAHLTAR